MERTVCRGLRCLLVLIVGLVLASLVYDRTLLFRPEWYPTERQINNLDFNAGWDRAGLLALGSLTNRNFPFEQKYDAGDEAHRETLPVDKETLTTAFSPRLASVASMAPRRSLTKSALADDVVSTDTTRAAQPDNVITRNSDKSFMSVPSSKAAPTPSTVLASVGDGTEPAVLPTPDGTASDITAGTIEQNAANGVSQNNARSIFPDKYTRAQLGAVSDVHLDVKSKHTVPATNILPVVQPTQNAQSQIQPVQNVRPQLQPVPNKAMPTGALQITGLDTRSRTTSIHDVVGSRDIPHGESPVADKAESNFGAEKSAPTARGLSTRLGDRSEHCSDSIPDLEEIKVNSTAKGFFPGPFQFLTDFRNPCWRSDITQEGVACLPFFHVAGFPKCGSTDLHVRLFSHPHVVRPVTKETHWVARRRFWKLADDASAFKQYVENFAPVLTADTTNANFAIREQRDEWVNPRIIGDSSITTAYEHLQWKTIPGNQGCDEPRVLNADVIRHMTPHAKIIFIVRNPTDRTFSDYWYFYRRWKKQPEAFHTYVQKQVAWLQQCFHQHSVRQCAYTFPSPDHVRMKISLYSVFIEDWLKRFPRDQIYVIRLEDWAVDRQKELINVFRFLDLGIPSNESMQQMSDWGKANAAETERNPMSSTTKTLLDTFFRPFNKRLATLLGDDKFLWEDQ